MARICLTNSVESACHHVVFDVETTGLSPGNGDRVIEIGAVAIQDKGVAEEFHSLINPGRPIPEAVQKIHGITNEMLAGKPRSQEVLPLFHKFIGRSPLIAHNARFDVNFLKFEFQRLGLKLTNRYLCTLEISRKLHPKLPNHRLETVYSYLFGSMKNDIRRHRALDDARLTARIWLELERRGSLHFRSERQEDVR